MEEDSEDSLDLLLDTLCNAFGGIILITLLIALMSQEANNAPAKPKSFKTEWMLEQQAISKIENEIVIEESINSTLQREPGNDPSGKVAAALQEKTELEQEKETLAENIARLQKMLASMPANSSNLAVDLQRQLRALQQMDLENERLEKQLKAEVERAGTKLAETNRDIKSSKSERTQTLRLPKEKGRTGKKYIWVIVKHGKLYPLNHPDAENLFTFTKVGATSLRFTPVRSEGMSPFNDQAEIINHFRKINPRSEYLAFEVFADNDCFKSLNQAKQIAASMGIGYTWSPLDRDFIGTTSGGTDAGSEL